MARPLPDWDRQDGKDLLRGAGQPAHLGERLPGPAREPAAGVHQPTGTSSGITSADCAEVKDAVDATEMHLIPTAAPNPEAPVCDTGQPTTLFSDDLENTSSGNWTTSGTGWYYPQNNGHPYPGFDATYATSGTTNFWGDNRGVTSDHTITKATGWRCPTALPTCASTTPTGSKTATPVPTTTAACWSTARTTAPPGKMRARSSSTTGTTEQSATPSATRSGSRGLRR